jgi:Carbohydrate binding domain
MLPPPAPARTRSRPACPGRTRPKPWVVQLRQRDIALQVGRSYTVSFAAKASAPRPIGVVVQKSVSPYTEYFGQRVNLTTGWSRYTYRFTMPTNESSAMLALNLAQATGQVGSMMCRWVGSSYDST